MAASWDTAGSATCPRRRHRSARSAEHAAPALPAARRLKRAGLDYWPAVCVDVHPSWAAFIEFWQQQPGPKQLVGEATRGCSRPSAGACMEVVGAAQISPSQAPPPRTVAACAALLLPLTAGRS